MPYMQWGWNESESGGGGTGRTQSAKKYGRAPPLFGSKCTSTCRRFGERFRDGKYSLVSFLFAVLLFTVPCAQPFVKVGGTCPRALWSRRHCTMLSVFVTTHHYYDNRH